MSDQGIVLKRTTLDGKPALVIGGGSSSATLWAVYELVEHWGVRYLQLHVAGPVPAAGTPTYTALKLVDVGLVP